MNFTALKNSLSHKYRNGSLLTLLSHHNNDKISLIDFIFGPSEDHAEGFIIIYLQINSSKLVLESNYCIIILQILNYNDNHHDIEKNIDLVKLFYRNMCEGEISHLDGSVVIKSSRRIINIQSEINKKTTEKEILVFVTDDEGYVYLFDIMTMYQSNSEFELSLYRLDILLESKSNTINNNDKKVVSSHYNNRSHKLIYSVSEISHSNNKNENKEEFIRVYKKDLFINTKGNIVTNEIEISKCIFMCKYDFISPHRVPVYPSSVGVWILGHYDKSITVNFYNYSLASLQSITLDDYYNNDIVCVASVNETGDVFYVGCSNRITIVKCDSKGVIVILSQSVLPLDNKIIDIKVIRNTLTDHFILVLVSHGILLCHYWTPNSFNCTSSRISVLKSVKYNFNVLNCRFINCNLKSCDNNNDSNNYLVIDGLCVYRLSIDKELVGYRQVSTLSEKLKESCNSKNIENTIKNNHFHHNYYLNWSLYSDNENLLNNNYNMYHQNKLDFEFSNNNNNNNNAIEINEEDITLFFTNCISNNLFDSEIIDAESIHNINMDDDNIISNDFVNVLQFPYKSDNEIEILDLQKFNWIDQLNIVDLHPFQGSDSFGSRSSIDPFLIIEFTQFLKPTVLARMGYSIMPGMDDSNQTMKQNSFDFYIHNLLETSSDAIPIIINFHDIQNSQYSKLEYEISIMNIVSGILADLLEDILEDTNCNDDSAFVTVNEDVKYYQINPLFISVLVKSFHIAQVILNCSGNKLSVMQQDNIIKVFLLNNKRVEVIDLFIKWNRALSLYLFCLRFLISYKFHSSECDMFDLSYYSDGRGIYNKSNDFEQKFSPPKIVKYDEDDYKGYTKLENRLVETVYVFEKSFSYFIKNPDYLIYAIDIVKYKPNAVSLDFISLLFDKYAAASVNNSVNKNKIVNSIIKLK